VTVNGIAGNLPSPTTPASQTACHGQQTLPVVFSSIPGTTFTWSNSNPLIGLAAAGSGNIPAFTAVNTANYPVYTEIVVTPYNDTCAGLPRKFYITINPEPEVSFQSLGCAGGSVTLTSSGWASYQWSTGAVTSQITVPNPGIYALTVTDYRGCTGTNLAELDQQAQPAITINEYSGKESNDGIFCTGSAATLISSVGNAYSWSNGYRVHP
jgi:hypothetical protein